MLKKIFLGVVLCALLFVLLPLSFTAPKVMSVFKMTPEPEVIVRGTTGSALTVDISFGDSELEQWLASLSSPYPLVFIDMDWAKRFPDSVQVLLEKNMPVALLGATGKVYEDDESLLSQQLNDFQNTFHTTPLWFRTRDEQFPSTLLHALWKKEVNALGSTQRFSGGTLPKPVEGEILSVAFERKSSITLKEIDQLLKSREFHSVEDVLFATTVKTKKIPK